MIRGIVGTVVASMALCGVASAGEQPSPRRWAWLEGTVWYVPQESLTAIATNATNTAVMNLLNQTVYSIDGYSGGLFWGVARVQVMRPPVKLPADPDDEPYCMRVAGSVTPQGTLNLSFLPRSGGYSTTGIGFMQRYESAWTMELQTTSSAPGEQVSQWAYMRSCPETGRCPLPAIRGSAKAFLKPCREMMRP